MLRYTHLWPQESLCATLTTACVACYRSGAMASVAALERGLKILDLLIEVEADAVRRPHGVPVQQVAAELGVHKSTASRLMQTLVANGYAVPGPGSRRGLR